jgi:hypothetical protein
MTFALVKHNNNSLSSITSGGQLSQGKMTLIKEQTASSSSSISFVDGSSSVVFDNTYPIYLFKIINCHPSNNDISFQFQGSTNSGSSYGVTITSTHFRATHGEDGSSEGVSYISGGDLSQSTSYQLLAGSIGSDNDQSISGEMIIFNPSGTTHIKHFLTNVNSVAHSDRSNNQYASGYFNTTSAIDAIDFKFSSGTIDSGSIKLYGIKGS